MLTKRFSAKTLWTAALLWAVCLLGLAQFSGFHIGEVRSLNWDIVLMLTPWGLIQNLALGANDYLYSAYWTVPPEFAWGWSLQGWYWHYLYILFQSNLIEVLLMLLLWPRLMPKNTWALRITATNAISHPVVFFVLMKLPFGYLWNILIAEAFAIGFETLVYRRVFGLKQAFTASLLANLVSWQLAPVLTALIFLRDRL